MLAAAQIISACRVIFFGRTVRRRHKFPLSRSRERNLGTRARARAHIFVGNTTVKRPRDLIRPLLGSSMARWKFTVRDAVYTHALVRVPPGSVTGTAERRRGLGDFSCLLLPLRRIYI